MLPSKPPVIFFSVGEPSGDLHGANLIRQLQQRCPDLEAVGYGGPMMAEAGCQLHADLTALAVMWFARALANIHKFLALMRCADRYFRDHRPDAVVLIDYPGFNWWIARRAKARGIPVFYYCPPQVWAWARWRVKKMRRLVDHVLCSLPFEAPWFRRHGCNATFVGHPFFDEVRRHVDDEAFIAEHRRQPGPLVAILPGSRTQEVTNNLRDFLKAAVIVHRSVPDARFAIASFKPHQAEIARRMVDESNSFVLSASAGHGAAVNGNGQPAKAGFANATDQVGTPIEICVAKTPELMRLADCAMSVSGSVSLELLCHATPTVILYRISRLAFFVQRFFLKVKYITLVNLLATGGLDDSDSQASDPRSVVRADGPGRANSVPKLTSSDSIPFPEYLTCNDKSSEIAAHIIEWLTDPSRRADRIETLTALKNQVAHGGASRRAAEYILTELASREAVPRPHCPSREPVSDA